MKVFRAAALVLLIGSGAVYPLRADDEKIELKASEWYPLAVGTTWRYKVGDQKLKITVAAHEKVGDVPCARLETTNAAGAIAGTEHVTIKEDGVYRLTYNGTKITPPLCFLKLPPKKGTQWKVKSKEGEAVTKGTFTLDEEDDVEVPAGTYKTIVSKGDMTAGDKALTVTFYFASGIGMVKQEIAAGGQVLAVELAKFEAAGSAPKPPGDAKKGDDKKDGEKKDKD
jgi:hypothetical protein